MLQTPGYGNAYHVVRHTHLRVGGIPGVNSSQDKDSAAMRLTVTNKVTIGLAVLESVSERIEQIDDVIDQALQPTIQRVPERYRSIRHPRMSEPFEATSTPAFRSFAKSIRQTGAHFS